MYNNWPTCAVQENKTCLVDMIELSIVVRPVLMTQWHRVLWQTRQVDDDQAALLPYHLSINNHAFGCECLKGLFPMVMPRSTCGSSHRSLISHLGKDCGLLHATIYSFLLSDCLLLDVVPCRLRSHVSQPTGRRHLSTISARLQKTTKTASASTFIPWPSLIN